MATTFFLSANSGEGFQSLLPRFDREGDWYDVMLVKDGPGIGKSLFLQQLGTAMETAGTPVEYLASPDEPDRPDGVVLPKLRCAALNASAPHAWEPRYPAAVERIVDLERFYDVTAAKAEREQIVACTTGLQAANARAAHALQAARQVELSALTAVQPDLRRIERRMAGIAARELRRRGGERGETAWRFLGGMTDQGAVWRFDSVETLCPRIYELQDSFGFAGAALERMCVIAVKNGWDVIACVTPEELERIEHLAVPGLGVAFVTSRTDMEFSGKPHRRVRLDAAVHIENRARLRLENRITRLLREEAADALHSAKIARDALRAAYAPYVDYDGIQALAAMETGRLLSWM
jgi:hypothetical protein